MRFRFMFFIIFAGCTILSAGTINFASYQTLPAGNSAWVIAADDISNDTRIDVVIAQNSYNDTLYVFLQNTSGNLVLSATYPAWNRAEGIDIGDIDNDTKNDVVLVDFENNQLVVFYQNDSGSLNGPFVHPTCTGPDGIRIGDLNSDSRNDVVVSHYNEDSLGVFYQNISGGLDPIVTYYAPQAGYDEIEIGDIDNDSDLDVVFMRGQLIGDHILVYKQNSSGTLDPAIGYDVPEIPHCIAIGDLNYDSREDLAVGYGGNQPFSKLGIFYQNATGSLSVFQEYPGYDVPEAVEIADFDLDGRKDIVVLHGGWMQMSIYQQNLSGSLNPYQLFAIPYASHYAPQGLDIGDINNDGKSDVVIADYNNGLVYLLNSSIIGIVTHTKKRNMQLLWKLPSSSSGDLRLHIPAQLKNKHLSISVFSIDGREIYSKSINTDVVAFDRILTKPGIYFIEIKTEKDIIFSQKIVRF